MKNYDGKSMIEKAESWTARGLRTAAFVWMLLLLVLIVGADLKAPESLVGNDYHTAFHVAGWMVAHGQLDLLYPPAGATTFHGAPFDLIVHKMLPSVDSHLVGQFMYSPLVAYLFAPLSNFAPATGQLIWQTINFILLAATCWLITAIVENNGEGAIAASQSSKDLLTRALKAVTILSFSFCFLPVFNTLWLGQMDIVLGLLPLSFGAWLITRKKAMLAGLIFSIVALKPQFFPVVVLICFGLVLRKQWRVLIGLVLSLLTLGWITIDTAGATITNNWIASLKISEAMFTGDYRNPDNLAGSLPLATLVAFAPHDRLKWKALVYVITTVTALFNVWVVVLLSRLKTEFKAWFQLLLIVAILPIFVYSPRLLTYDWILMILPMALILINDRADRLVVLATLALFVCINIEIILQFTCTGLVNPMALTLVGTVLISVILRQSLLVCEKL